MADIIELGEDGSFDIATTPVKQLNFIPHDYEEFSTTNNVTAEELILDSIAPGEYKILSSNSNVLFIVIRLDADENLLSVELEKPTTLAFKTSKRIYSVDMKEFMAHPNAKDISVKKWNDIVSVQLPIR